MFLEEREISERLLQAKSSLQETGVQSMTFHQLSGNCLSLAEWLLGEEKILLLLNGVVERNNSFLLKMDNMSLPVWSN